MTSPAEREKDRIREASRLIHEAMRPVQVLSHLAWGPEVREAFFASGARNPPAPVYRGFDLGPTLERLRAVRRMVVPTTTIDIWLERQVQSVETGARMLAAVGTSSFFEHSREAFGEPTEPLRYLPVSSLDLAKRIHRVIEELGRVEIDVAPLAYQDSEQVARFITAGLENFDGADAPRVEVVETLSANALAAPDRIRVRRGARFTDRDANQLLEHEAFIHVATSLNGRSQTDLPSLADDHPATTRAQEGLAVLAEVMSSTLELDRMRRLADRVVAIQMAIEGADFLDVYRWFLERTADRGQAFENTRRVFRGGVLTGGAPFTKDVVYLFGLLQVANAVRAAFSVGRADCIPLLFVGKVDVGDIPALAELTDMGLCKPPRFVPRWIADPRFLLAFLCLSTFRSGLDETPLQEAAVRLLAQAPLVRREPPPRAKGAT